MRLLKTLEEDWKAQSIWEAICQSSIRQIEMAIVDKREILQCEQTLKDQPKIT
jgi:hypothetical protein